jgi:two-component system, NarL family, response regulator DegU
MAHNSQKCAIIIKNLGQSANKMKNNMKLCNLTNRERDVAILVAKGLLYKEIAKKLYISPQVVKNYMNRISRKLDINEGRPGILIARWVWEQDNE